MKVFFVFLISYFTCSFSLCAQCDTDLDITGQLGTMPQSANAHKISIQNSSVTPGQVIIYRAGESIDINQDFDAVPEGQITPVSSKREGVVDMQISQTNSFYKIGAWYHTAWYLDCFWADRERGFNIGDKYDPINYPNDYINGIQPLLQSIPSYHNIADVWYGVRNVASNDGFYKSKISEMDPLSSYYEPNYSKSRQPLLGFYDLSDQRIIDNQIQMAASKGINFFSFYNYYDNEGNETSSSRIVQRFKSSQNKNLMKYMISIWQPETFNSFYNSGVYNFQTFVTTILNQLSDPIDSTNLDPSYLTTPEEEGGQPIIALSPAALFIHDDTNPDATTYNIEADNAFNQLANAIRIGIYNQFSIYPIILLIADTSWEGGRAKDLMNTGKITGSDIPLYDGYIGIGQLSPTNITGSPFNKDYANLTDNDCLGGNNFTIINNLDLHTSPTPKYKFNIPSINVGFDVRPWIPVPYGSNTNYSPYYFSNTSPGAFAQMLSRYKTYIDNNMSPTGSKTSNNMLMCYAWNEWGENGLIEPSVAHGYGYLNALKDTFCLTSSCDEPDLAGFSTSYQEWSDSKTWGNNANAYAEDPDGDGLENILEYAFDLDPLVCNSFDNPSSLPYYNTNYDSVNYWPNAVPSQLTTDINDPNYLKYNIFLKYQRDYKKNDLIYFVEAYYSHPSDSEQIWKLYNDTNWSQETNAGWANIITPPSNGSTIEVRDCSPHLRPREVISGYDEDFSDKSINGLRLVIGYLKQDRLNDPIDPIERFVFPPSSPINCISSNKISTINHNTIKNSIIYPNPSKSGLFDVNLRDNTKAFLEITNIIGQRITFNSLHEENKIKLDLTDKASGIYLVKITQNNISETFKLIIEK